MKVYDILSNLNEIPLGTEQGPWTLLFAWLIVASWFLDLYALVKKKSQRETFAVMAFPGCVAFMVAMLSTTLMGISTDRSLLLENIPAFLEEETCGELLLLALVYLVLWVIAVKLRGRKNDTWKMRLLWSVSYIPDLVTAGIMLILSLTLLGPGRDFFAGKLLSLSETETDGAWIFVWLFAYGIQQLLLRMLLLLTVIFARLATIRIPLKKYPDGGHPLRRIFCYVAFCQNAYLRGVLTLSIPAGIFFTLLVTMLSEDPHAEWPMIILFVSLIHAAAALYILITLKPSVAALRNFERWGDKKTLAEQFCQEFFNEEPVFRTENFTVTRHYLVDERSVAEIYYLEMLDKWSCVTVLAGDNASNHMSKAYTVDKSRRSGWEWMIRFMDGKICSIEKEDRDVERVLALLKQYQEIHLLGMHSSQEIPQLKKERRGIYDMLFKAVLIWLLITFMLLYFSTTLTST